MRIESNVRFSLIVPTRNRLDRLCIMLDSFYSNANLPERVETILLADYDDLSTRNWDRFLKDRNIKITFQRRSPFISKHYVNWGMQCSTGQYVWLLNDDTTCETKHWDDTLFQKAQEFKKDTPLFYGWIGDDTLGNRQDDIGCCFPVLSKETVDLLENFGNEIEHWGYDCCLYQVFPKDKICDLRDTIKIKHWCRHNKTADADETALHVGKISRMALLTPDQKKYWTDLLNTT